MHANIMTKIMPIIFETVRKWKESYFGVVSIDTIMQSVIACIQIPQSFRELIQSGKNMSCQMDSLAHKINALAGEE